MVKRRMVNDENEPKEPEAPTLDAVIAALRFYGVERPTIRQYLTALASQGVPGAQEHLNAEAAAVGAWRAAASTNGRLNRRQRRALLRKKP